MRVGKGLGAIGGGSQRWLDLGIARHAITADGGKPDHRPGIAQRTVVRIGIGQRRLVDQAERAGAVLVLRGLKNQSMRQTVAAVSELLGRVAKGEIAEVDRLHALGLANAKKAGFLVASTSEIYGDPERHPQKEDYWGNVNPIGPRSVYDEAKRFAEALTMAYHREHGVATRIVRIFNTYGPRMRLRDGRVVHLRSIHASDEAEVLQAFDRLSPEARYMRFMRVVKALDAGPMLAAARRPIGRNETSLDVAQLLEDAFGTITPIDPRS